MTQPRRYKVAILTGPQFDDVEHFEIVEFFANRGYAPEVMSDLRGVKEVEFHGNDPDRLGRKITVKRDVRNANIGDYDGVVVVGGYCSAYLRVPDVGQAEAASVALVRRALMDGSTVVGVHCHSLWLLTAAPDLLAGRKVTCNHNVVWDVINAGADVQFSDGGERTLDSFADGLLVTGRERSSTRAFCEAVFQLLERPRS